MGDFDDFVKNEGGGGGGGGEFASFVKSRIKGADVAEVVDDELSRLGYSGTQRLSILGDVGRENSWNRDTIFKGHSDPKNGKYNRGLISWQGDRQTNLDNYLKKNNLYGRNDDDEIRGMVRFMDEEMRTRYPSQYKALRSAKTTYDASEAMRSYVGYVPDAPYNTFDPDFRVQRNKEWATQAKNLGLGAERTRTGGGAYDSFVKSGEFDSFVKSGEFDDFAKSQKVTGQTSNVPPVNPQNAPVEMIVPQPDQPPAPKTIFDKQGNPVQAIGGLDPNPPADKPPAPPVQDQNQQLEAYRNYSKNELAAGRQPQTFADFTASTETQNPAPPATVQPTAPLKPQITKPAPPKTAASPSAPVLSDADTLAVLKYKGLKDTPENRAIVQNDASRNAGFGKGVEVSAAVNAPDAPARNANQTSPPAVIPPDAVQEIQSPNIKTYKTVQESLDSSAGSYRVDLSKKPAGMNLRDYIFRATFAPVAARYGLSVDEAMRKMQAGQGGLLKHNDAELAAMGDKETADYIRTHGNNYTVSYSRGLVNWLLGGTPDNPAEPLKKEFSERQTDASMNAAMRDPLQFAPESQKQLQAKFNASDYQRDLEKQQNDPDYIYRKEAERLTDSSPFYGSTEADLDELTQHLKRSALSDAEKKEVEDYGKELGQSRWGQLYAGAVGEGAKFADFWNGLIGRPLRAFGFDLASETYSRMSEAMRRQSEAASSSADSYGKGLIFLGSLPLALSRVIILSRLPGGAIAGFATDAGFQSAGRGQNLPEVAGHALQGAVTGALFGVANKAEEMLTEAGLRSLLAKAFKIGTVTTGTYPLEKAGGATDEEALQASLMNAGFELFNAGGEKALDRFYKIWTGGKEHYIYLDKNKQVSVVPKVDDSFISAEIVQPEPKSTETKTVKTEESGTLEGKTVTDKDGRRGTVKTDSGATKGVIVEWEDGKTSQINRKKLSVADENAPAPADVVQPPAETPVSSAENTILAADEKTAASPERPQSDFDKTRAVTEDENGNLSLKTIETKVPEEVANGGENMQKNMQTAPETPLQPGQKAKFGDRVVTFRGLDEQGDFRVEFEDGSRMSLSKEAKLEPLDAQTAPDSESLLGKTIEREDGRRGKVVGENENTKTVQVEWEDGSFGGAPRRTVSVIEPDVQAAPEPVQTQPVKAPETQENKPIQPVQAPVEMFKKIDSLANLPKEERQAALKQMKSDYDGSGFERARRINGNIAEIVRRMEEKGVLEKICD